MKLLILHTHYQQPGGEDQSFASETTLLREQGHDVQTLIFHNRNMDGMSAWRQARVTLWNQETYRRTRAAIQKHHPQLVHVNNTFPIASLGVVHAAMAFSSEAAILANSVWDVSPGVGRFTDATERVELQAQSWRGCLPCIGAWAPGVTLMATSLSLNLPAKNT
jgi:hypothetical protein